MKQLILITIITLLFFPQENRTANADSISAILERRALPDTSCKRKSPEKVSPCRCLGPEGYLTKPLARLLPTTIIGLIHDYYKEQPTWVERSDYFPELNNIINIHTLKHNKAWCLQVVIEVERHKKWIEKLMILKEDHAEQLSDQTLPTYSKEEPGAYGTYYSRNGKYSAKKQCNQGSTRVKSVIVHNTKTLASHTMKIPEAECLTGHHFEISDTGNQIMWIPSEKKSFKVLTYSKDTPATLHTISMSEPLTFDTQIMSRKQLILAITNPGLELYPIDGNGNHHVLAKKGISHAVTAHGENTIIALTDRGTLKIWQFIPTCNNT